MLVADINDSTGCAPHSPGAVLTWWCSSSPTGGRVLRDIGLFTGITGRYIFISTASAYQKPPRNYLIDESVPLHNPYWQYSRDKANCEKLLTEAYNKDFFPFTIVRPSHTYGESKLPLALHGAKGSWQALDRMLRKKPVIIPDGTSLWTSPGRRTLPGGWQA